MSRYARLLWAQLRNSLLLAMQYRYEFVVEGLLSLLWTSTALIPLFVIYQDRPTVAGWRFGESLLVVGWFTLLQGIIEGAISPSLNEVVERIRKGTLDFVLLKPADSQFLVSTAKFLPWRVINLIAAGVIFGYAFHLENRLPSLWGLGAALLLSFSSTVLLYSLWILTISLAFYVVKVDNLTYLFTSIFDAARWPSSVFRGLVSFIFTFVIPLTVMTTLPAQALLGRLPWPHLLYALAGSAAFAVAARRVWLGSISRYTSASS
jgi:ABC-2 type transport system permease protein